MDSISFKSFIFDTNNYELVSKKKLCQLLNNRNNKFCRKKCNATTKLREFG